MRTLMLFVLLPLAAFAQATLSLSSGSASPGGTVNLNLTLAVNGTAPAGIQFSFTVPAGMTISPGVGPADTTAAKSLSCAGTSTVICLVTGINTNILANGVVAVLTATAPLNSGTYNVGVVGTLGASLQGNAVTVTGTGGTLQVFSPFDLNKDGKTDILDLQQLIQQILGGQTASDFNGDAKTDILDAQLLTRAALGI